VASGAPSGIIEASVTTAASENPALVSDPALEHPSSETAATTMDPRLTPARIAYRRPLGFFSRAGIRSTTRMERTERPTLPPPEWTAPATAAREIAVETPPALARRRGGRAEEASRRGRVAVARALGDRHALHEEASSLARWLVSRDRDFAEAVSLASAALDAVPSDFELRRELSSWFESLGDHARAADLLEVGAGALEGAERAYVLVCVGVLRARSSDAARARGAFEAAAALDSSDAIGDEMLGALAAWAGHAVLPSVGATAYVEAARRRGASGSADAELEDLLRAVACDAQSESAARALAAAQEKRSTAAAADETMRAHANASASSTELHARRRREAMEGGDLSRAIGAALDEGLDAQFEGTAADTLNAMLLRVGLLDPLAARLEQRARRATGRDRAKYLLEIARMYSGPLADPRRAAAAYVEALASDPSSDEAVVALRAALGEAVEHLPGAGQERLRRIADGLRSVDDEATRHLRLIGELTVATGDDPRWEAAATRLQAREASDSEALATARKELESSPTSATAAATAWIAAIAAGDSTTRALALGVVARAAAPTARAVLLAISAEGFLAVGDRAAARRMAELACRADPASARALATLADVLALGGGEGAAPETRAAAVAVERAVHVVGARVAWCAALARALEAMGEHGYAVAWSQRLVALRPGDASALEQLIARILRARDPSRLGDTLSWTLSQPLPADMAGALTARALRELAQLDGDRAAVIARRALEVYGPRRADVRDALIEMADRAGDDAFAAAVLERHLAAAAPGEESATLFVALADRRARLGDRDGEAGLLARASRSGGRISDMQVRAARLLGEGVSADGELALMEARAAALSTGESNPAAANAWRDFGAAVWDLAGDRQGAVAAWLRAARLAPRRGFATLGSDLTSFGGAAFALDSLAALSEVESDAKVSGPLAIEAARAALLLGDGARAFDLAGAGLAAHPAYPDAIGISERAATLAGRENELSTLYDAVASRALGRFGRRAAHYRGARFFEQHDQRALALKHAALAFAAVPTEGATFLLLARTAERADDRAQAVRALEQVAERATRGRSRAAWLLRAAVLAGDDEEGVRRRVDVLFKAASLAPGATTIAMLSDAARELVRRIPEDRDVVEMRIARASRALTERLDGPEGARIALAFADLHLALFDDATNALVVIERALGMDADIDEYERFTPNARGLALADDAGAFLGRAIANASKPYANVGVPALKLFAAMAAARADETTRARAVILAAEHDQTDDALVIEADAASRQLGDDALTERLAKKVPHARRVEALRQRARDAIATGAHAEATTALERAAELATDATRVEIEHDLREAYESAGRGTEIEQRAQREAQADEITPLVRADRWTEIADRRERRRDMAGALRALTEAARLDAVPVARWSAIERVAELAGDFDARVEALREIAKRVENEGRVAVSKRLARAEESRGDRVAARAAYEDVLRIDPDDEEADHAIELLVVNAGAYEELVRHLARRVERLSARSGQREALRALRLRRAAILEQRLGRIGDACEELALLLSEWPDNSSALRYLADLYERAGDATRAAPLWRRAAALEVDPAAQDELEVRAARASLTAGDARSAQMHVRAVLVRNPTCADAVELRVDLARDGGDAKELGDALEALSEGTRDPIDRSNLLLEAAQSAGRHADDALALRRAQLAAHVAPERAATQLLARGLEYRQRGPGDPFEARKTIEELGRIREQLVRDDDTLRAFLLAEALDVVQGGAAGMRELVETHERLGETSPLLSAAIAERLTKQGSFSAALPYYERALSGTLFGLRRSSQVAMDAADVAVRCVQVEDALRFLDVAAADPDARWMARVRGAHLAVTQGWLSHARNALHELVSIADGEARAREIGSLVRIVLSTTDETQRSDAAALVAELAAATAPGFVRDAIEHERSAARPLAPPVPSAEPIAASPNAVEIVEPQRGAPPAASLEHDLWTALAGGSIEAGDDLVALLLAGGGRGADVVRALRAQVDRLPGDLRRLGQLHAAAIDDEDRVYARAIEHVLRAFDTGAGPLPPPPLAGQPEQPGILGVLAKPTPLEEALALAWEGAPALFARDPASYGIVGVARVVPGAATPLGRVYEAAIRALDTPRIPLYATRPVGALVATVALTQPPSVLLGGDAREESAELRFVLGRGMASALPSNALLLGLLPNEVATVFAALLLGFGPPDRGARVEREAAALAESFWQQIPARAQRRLQELLVSGVEGSLPALVDHAHQSARRVGLFVSGDFGVATRALRAERQLDVESLSAPGALRAACSDDPQLADLFRLAVSPEYANARWHPVAPASQRGTMSSGRFSIV
jgi:hypothetical protein